MMNNFKSSYFMLNSIANIGYSSFFVRWVRISGLQIPLAGQETKAPDSRQAYKAMQVSANCHAGLTITLGVGNTV